MIGAVWIVPQVASAKSDDNIWAEDLASARANLQRAQDRASSATSDLATAQSELPGAQAAVDRLLPIASRREAEAQRIVERADAREASVHERRLAAFRTVQIVQADEHTRTSHWRGVRARWVSIAAALIALACAVLLAGAISRRARSEDGRERQALISALLLGSSAAVNASALIGALSLAGGWRFSWWAVGAAVVGVAGVVIATAVGWVRLPSRSPAAVTRGVAALACTLLLAAVLPTAIAVAHERPRPAQLDATTLRLAHMQVTQAPMPTHVQELRDRADRLDVKAQRARARANDADTQLSDLQTEVSDASDRQTRAQRSITQWSREVDDVQAEYDDYQQLLAEPDSLDVPSDTGPDDSSTLPDPPNAPTTEDFGNGNGSVGLCADGTLSDSIGRPGACSHHGGVL
jgi:predicted  nucleic acid-binding Zn-ribbon protein